MKKTLVVALTGMVLACGRPPAGRRVSMWAHAGPGPERDAYVASIKAFNASGAPFQVDLTLLPEGSYTDQIHAAALAGQLPDLLEFDGPYVYSYAWARRIIPADGFPELAAVRRDMLPTLVRQGTYHHRLYTLGQYDSGLALWGNRRLLARAGVQPPATLEGAWSLAQFEAVLERLKRSGVAYPLDMKLNYGAGEWFAYGFAPIIERFGGQLINPKDFRSAEGFLDGPGAVRAMTRVQA